MNSRVGLGAAYLPVGQATTCYQQKTSKFMRILVVTLIFLAPISAIAAAIYEIVAGKQEPTLYLLLAVTPGAIAGALKELRDSGLLPPNRLEFKIDASHANIKKWSRKKGEAIQQITDIIIPIRIENSDSGKAIDILDISITSGDSQVKFFRPEMREVKIGSEQKWIYTIADGGWSELFNDGKPTVIEAKKTKEYVIAVCEYETARDKYPICISFCDNWKRSYSEEIMVVGDDNDTSSGKAS
ncbi:MAG: hypothetical protein KJ063_24730 [Anaerolineae bacterium]|nr:hypothetical protein [Anaerolineae bacterium]